MCPDPISPLFINVHIFYVCMWLFQWVKAAVFSPESWNRGVQYPPWKQPRENPGKQSATFCYSATAPSPGCSCLCCFGVWVRLCLYGWRWKSLMTSWAVLVCARYGTPSNAYRTVPTTQSFRTMNLANKMALMTIRKNNVGFGIQRMYVATHIHTYIHTYIHMYVHPYIKIYLRVNGTFSALLPFCEALLLCTR